jgi:hypothetical protein
MLDNDSLSRQTFMKKYLFLFGCAALTLSCNLGVPAPTVESPPTQTPLPPPTADSSPNPSPSPEPPPAYFTDEFDAASPYWSFFQTGGAQPAITSFENSALRISASSPDTWLMGVHNAHTYSNVFLRANVSLAPGGSAGLICRYREDTGWYEFNAASDGAYSILLGQWLAPGVAKYIPIASGTRKLAGEIRDVELGFFCNEGLLELYVNNTLLRRYDATNYGLTEGGIGITAASLAQVPMAASFDWVSVNNK